ncbi:MAG: VWA domain-containing protein, partial [Candidatus Acidiferrales bacterium]
MKFSRVRPALILLFGISLLLAASSSAQKKEKLPRPVQMDAGVQSTRNPATGELVFHHGTGNAAATNAADARAAIRVRVNLVEVGCNVFATDGTAVRGLAQPDFHIFEDGVEQSIAHFDASAEGASIALVFDASPSVLPDSDTMKFAARQLIANISPVDEVAVVDFSEHTYLLLPFSRDRKLLEKAAAGVDVRKLFVDTGGSNIYRSVYLAANELFPG